jgi:hypothetical protein
MTSGAAAAPATPAPRRKRRLWLEVGLPVVLAIIAGVALWVWVALGFTYATGERTGYVKQLRHEGWLCKTWEGEMTVTPVPGVSQPPTFAFTIRSDSLAHALEAVAGKPVTVGYSQHKGVPGNCFGETEYYVESFRIAGGS